MRADPSVPWRAEWWVVTKVGLWAASMADKTVDWKVVRKAH